MRNKKITLVCMSLLVVSLNTSLRDSHNVLKKHHSGPTTRVKITFAKESLSTHRSLSSPIIQSISRLNNHNNFDFLLNISSSDTEPSNKIRRVK